MQAKLIIGTVVLISLSATSAHADTLSAKVSATYNTKTKNVTPTITLSQQFKGWKLSGYANIKSSRSITTAAAIRRGSTYVAEAAYTIMDARERFGIVAASNFTSPDVSGSLYSWDGTRLDGQPISGQTADGTFIKASRTLVTATQDIAEKVTKTPDTEFGIDAKVEVAKDLYAGAGVKFDGKKFSPYAAIEYDVKLAESISFFADIKAPMEFDQGVDISSGVKIDF